MPLSKQIDLETMPWSVTGIEARYFTNKSVKVSGEHSKQNLQRYDEHALTEMPWKLSIFRLLQA